MPTTFIILIRAESVERIENTLAVVLFLRRNIKEPVFVLECTSHNNGILPRLLGQDIRYEFVEDHDPILHRTKYLNEMVRSVNTPFIAIWDTDVIVPPVQVKEAISLLEQGDADMVYPYEKKFLDTSPILRRSILQCGDVALLEQHTKKMKEMYPPNPVGGAFLANRMAYIDSGLENEDFYGWGLEDGERYYRWQNKGFRIKRIPGSLFHLSHGRGINSLFQSPDQQFIKHKAILKEQKIRNIENSNTFEGSFLF